MLRLKDETVPESLHVTVQNDQDTSVITVYETDSNRAGQNLWFELFVIEVSTKQVIQMIEMTISFEPKLVPSFAEELTPFLVIENQNASTFASITLPEIMNEDTLDRITVLPDPTCEELKASYSTQQNSISVAVL